MPTGPERKWIGVAALSWADIPRNNELKESLGYEKIQRNFDGSRLSRLWWHRIPGDQAAHATRPQDLSGGLQALFWQRPNNDAAASGRVKPVRKSPVSRGYFSALASRQWLT